MRRPVLLAVLLAALVASCGDSISAQAPHSSVPLGPEALREWLTVISSDEFEGRATFSPGLDKAAAYIAARLKEAGVRPGGDDGSYLEKVAVETIQSTN